MGLMQMLSNLFKRFAPTKRLEEVGPLIDQWRQIYEGNPPWKKQKVTTINQLDGERVIKTLGGGKIVCKEIAALVWAEPAAVDAGEFIKAVLEGNAFNSRFPERIEYLAALGGICLKPIVEGGRLVIEYVPADRFIPTYWNSAGVYGGKFLDRQTAGDKKYVRIETHTPATIPATEAQAEQRGYQITNELYEQHGEEYRAVDLKALYKDMEASAFIPSDVPLFAYIKTPDANNLDMDSPAGISFFANSVDTLQSLDEAFDSINREIKLGRKRVIVPTAAIKAVVSSNGQTRRFFDANDEVYEAFDLEDAEKQKIIDNTTDIRVDPLVTAIQNALDLLAMQIGFTPGTLTFKDGGVKTATEIISKDSRTFKTVKNFQAVIGAGIVGMIKAAWAVAEYYKLPGVDRKEIAIKWDDSILEDRDSDASYWQKLTAAELASKRQAIMSIHKCTEAEADKILQQIAKERPATIDLGTFGADNNPGGGAAGAGDNGAV